MTNCTKLFHSSTKVSILLKTVFLSTLLLLSSNNLSAETKLSFKLPEFSSSSANDWLNSKPLQTSELKGKVLLIDFWAFACWNCSRSFPWLNALEKKFERQDFQVIGVHTPELESERNRMTLKDKVKEFQLKHPILIDEDYKFWRAMQNRAWPAFYVVDKEGIVRARFLGETHSGDHRALKIEETIKRLLG